MKGGAGPAQAARYAFRTSSTEGGTMNSDRDAQPPKPQQTPETREESLDKTIADSFPASDPPSTDPAPKKDEEAA